MVFRYNQNQILLLNLNSRKIQMCRRPGAEYQIIFFCCQPFQQTLGNSGMKGKLNI